MINLSLINLLTALDALLDEGQVSRAAEKIGITQAAMSNILRQLRALFDDPLLVRTGKEMKPTQLALLIEPKLKQIVQQIDSLLSIQSTFDPTNSNHIFNIGMSDAAELYLLPSLIELFLKKANQEFLSF